MTQEEKAKAYDSNYKVYTELINRLEDVKDAIKKQNYGIAMDVLCKPYPEFQITVSTEFQESEDERIRKELISFFTERAKYTEDSTFNGLSSKEIIAWVEKQGEHANFRNKIQVGDKVTRNEDGVLVNLSQLNRVAKKQTEQKLYVNDNAKEMFIKALERVEEQNNKGYKLTDCDKNSWWEDFKAYTSCTIEQKHAAWSEEDEYCIHQLIVFCENCMVQDNGAKRCAHWLKSLRPQKQWKPSDEQMIALRQVISGCSYDIEPLVEIEKQLKKLREE